MSKTPRRRRSFGNSAILYYVVFSLLLTTAIIGYFILPEVRYGTIYVILFLFLALFTLLIMSRFQLVETILDKLRLPEDIRVTFSRKKDQAVTEPLASINVEEMPSTKTEGSRIFYVDTPLPDLKEFYGRKMEYGVLINRIRVGGSTSIVGGPKSGKSWLAYYTFQKVRSDFGDKQIRAGYIDAAQPDLESVADFVKKVLLVLSFSSHLSSTKYTLAFLDEYIRDLREKQQTPVVFIDNFEALVGKIGFEVRFFEALRAMTQIGLVLVIVSRESLIRVVSRTTNRSPFFNVFEQVKLHPFDVYEAQNFIHAKAKQAQLSEQEQEQLLQYGRDRSGGWPPLRLQLVGKMLLERRARSVAQNDEAKKYTRDFEKSVEREYSVLSAR